MGGVGSGGHNRKGTAEHVAGGTYRRHRHDSRSIGLRKLPGVPRIPDGLAQPERELLEDVIAMLGDATGAIDSGQLAMLAAEHCLYRRATERVLAGDDNQDVHRLRKQARDAVLKLCDAFGCNPKSRIALRLADATPTTGGTLARLLQMRESDQ